MPYYKTTYWLEVQTTNEEEEEYVEIELELGFDAYYQKAYISGLPEDCYPSEGELTINECIYKLPENVTQEAFDAAYKAKEDSIEDKCWDAYFDATNADYHCEI
jgi:hypothetical protein